MDNYKKIKISILFLLIIFSCTNKQTNVAELVNAELKGLNINAEAKINKVSNDNLNIDILFSEPYRIVELEHQDILSYYLTWRLKDELLEYQKVKFIFSYKNDDQILNNYEVSYNKEKIQSIYNKNGAFFNLVKYCLKEFNFSDTTAFNNIIKNTSINTKGYTLDTTFFKLLNKFSSEDKSSKSNLTFLFIYNFYKDYSNPDDKEGKKIYDKITYYISQIWKLGKGNNIEDDVTIFNKALAELNGYEYVEDNNNK